MINPRERFASDGSSYFSSPDDPEAETRCRVWDFDRRRMVSIKGTAKLFRPEQCIEEQIMARFADVISSNIYSVTVDDDGMMTGFSDDPKEDITHFVAYLPFSIVKSLADCRTIQHSKLQELDRLGPDIDLSSYEDEHGVSHKVAFKYNTSPKSRMLHQAWNEVHLLKSLPPHPNLVPFDRVVLDDVESRIIGFTTKYISGGTLEETNIPFRFEWIQQLTQLVDFLNLDLGIMHQDIASRNLLIDPVTHKILLFDFNFATNRPDHLLDGRDDVTGVVTTLYELITNDLHIQNIPHWDRNIDMVQNVSEWIPKRELDCDVSKFRNFINDWVAARKSEGILESFCNAPNRINIPEIPEAHLKNHVFEAGQDINEKPIHKMGAYYRRDALKKGYYCFDWERLPKNKLSLEKPRRCG